MNSNNGTRVGTGFELCCTQDIKYENFDNRMQHTRPNYQRVKMLSDKSFSDMLNTKKQIRHTVSIIGKHGKLVTFYYPDGTARSFDGTQWKDVKVEMLESLATFAAV